ncbi:hypothetical protein EXT46_05430 [Pseudoalteromonas sp. CO325X]|uniref:hypothetical protein n=1 Tax=Pseudoalteromonas sp. CO325X TaxID=1777262 RepID=UPI0010234D17|nr:hypothetical protein [Pseudoalteromonas sp. CO325X]RZF83735.1 hypothetical protein EXT46_05430 [Pseudoalteromonas sp. CO325X]
MKIQPIISELERRGLQVLSMRKGNKRHVFEVCGKAPNNLPVITEKRGGQTRSVRSATLFGQLILFIEGEANAS